MKGAREVLLVIAQKKLLAEAQRRGFPGGCLKVRKGVVVAKKTFSQRRKDAVSGGLRYRAQNQMADERFM